MDDENDSDESYAIVSEQGLEYESTETVADVVEQIHHLVHGPKRDLGMLRSLTEDLRALVVANPELVASDSLGTLDGLNQLPAGWRSEATEADEADDE